MNDTIDTYTGKLYNIHTPASDTVCIQDIAHALSLICRYGGHCKRFYSVAEHCVLGTKFLPSVRERQIYLLHDASEAYLGDVVTPLKRMLPDYVKYEKACSDIIYTALIGRVPTAAEYETSRAIDQRMLLAESKVLMECRGDGWSKNICEGRHAVGVGLQHWTPCEAEQQYLDTWRALTSESTGK